MKAVVRLLSFLFKEETRAAIYIPPMQTTPPERMDSLAFIKVLMLYDEIVKVIMTVLPFTQLSHSELLFSNSLA